MRRVDVLVTLSAVHTQPLSVPVWELPILAVVHGDQIKEVGQSRCDARVPEPAEEYARLMRRYGNNKETMVPRVQEVYGADMIGVRNLAQAMRDDLEEQAELDAVVARQSAAEAEANRSSASSGPAQQSQSAPSTGASQSPADPPKQPEAAAERPNAGKRGAGGR